jgi:glucose dehydrogenase
MALGLILSAITLTAQTPIPTELTAVTDSEQHAKPVPEFSGAKGSAPPVAKTLTSDRILKARSEPHNWLTYYGAYDGQRYSALDQINAANVKTLRPAWVFQYGVIGLQATPATYSFEAAPIVVDGVMYVSGWDGLVWALDAVTGQLLWQYKHALPLGTRLFAVGMLTEVSLWQTAKYLLPRPIAIYSLLMP